MNGSPPRFDRSVVVVPTKHACTEMFADDELAAVVFDDRTGGCHRLNSVATAVWALCDGSTSIGELIGELADLLNVSPDVAAEGVLGSIEQFWSFGLLE